MKRLTISVIGQQPVEPYLQLSNMLTLHKHIYLVKGNHIAIGNIFDKIIHGIINQNMLLTTKINSIVVIEEQNKIIP